MRFLQTHKSLLYTAAAVLSLCVLLAAARVFYQVLILEIHNRVSVGMSQRDVESRLGPPQAVTKRGEALQPPHVSGFTPEIENDHLVYTYRWYGAFVYVYFDARGKVKAYYVTHT